MVTTTVIPTIGDIERYLRMRLDKDPAPSAMDDSLRAEIMKVVPRNMSKIPVETANLTIQATLGIR